MSGYDLVGEHVLYSENPDGSSTIAFSKTGNGRSCGDCQLCCKLLPVPLLDKPANARCRHQRTGKGCTIYANRPHACRVFACRWLADKPGTADLTRPDRAHYVIDLDTDYITATDNAAGTTRRIGAYQVWCDPAFPEAHRDPPLRAWMARMGERWGVCTIIRFNERDALVVFPPAFSHDGKWQETRNAVLEQEHRPSRVMNVDFAP